MRGHIQDAGTHALGHMGGDLRGVVLVGELDHVAFLDAELLGIGRSDPDAFHVVFARDGGQRRNVAGHGMRVDALLAARDEELSLFRPGLARDIADHRIEPGVADLFAGKLDLA